jgi:hypothetical protein
LSIPSSCECACGPTGGRASERPASRAGERTTDEQTLVQLNDGSSPLSAAARLNRPAWLARRFVSGRPFAATPTMTYRLVQDQPRNRALAVVLVCWCDEDNSSGCVLCAIPERRILVKSSAPLFMATIDRVMRAAWWWPLDMFAFLFCPYYLFTHKHIARGGYTGLLFTTRLSHNASSPCPLSASIALFLAVSSLSPRRRRPFASGSRRTGTHSLVVVAPPLDSIAKIGHNDQRRRLYTLASHSRW